MNEIEDRPYQDDGIQMVYEHFRAGLKRVIFWGQTGMGKSVVFSKMIEDNYKWGCHVVFVVKRRELIKQASKHLDNWGIPHGVYMANHHRFRPFERVQICSIDTLGAREVYPHADKDNVFIVVDESHDCTPTARNYAKFILSYPQAFIVGFTATPFSNNSLWEAIVKPIEAHELRDQGYLVPERTFVPNIIDISNVSIKRNGEFNEHELFEASAKSEIIGDFVRDWKNYSQERPTILFACNIEHSKIITESYNSAGIRALHIDGTTKSRDRVRAIEKLISGKIQVLSNVDVFTVGLDVPPVSCIQICRPTQSIIWHLQSIGRGLRPSPNTGKENCIIIDNAGNTLRHGTVYKVREAEIGKPRKRTAEELEEGDISVRTCKRCHYLFESGKQECPDCGFVNPIVQRKIKHSDGELIEYQISDEEKEMLIKSSFVSDYHKLGFVSRRRKLGKNWVYNTLEEKYGLTVCKRYGKLVQLKY